MSNHLLFSLIFLLSTVSLLAWILWNFASKRWSLPCPSQLAWMVEMENPFARHTRSPSVIEFLHLGGDERVLEVGCGPGRISIPLAKALHSGGKLVSLDIQREMLDRVEGKRFAEKLKNLELVVSDIRDFRCESACFDRILLVMSLGEIPEAKSALQQMKPWLRKDGEIIICESVFDPHYIRRKRLIWMLVESGYCLTRINGNLFGYLAAFSKKDQDYIA